MSSVLEPYKTRKERLMELSIDELMTMANKKIHFIIDTHNHNSLETKHQMIHPCKVELYKLFEHVIKLALTQLIINPYATITIITKFIHVKEY